MRNLRHLGKGLGFDQKEPTLCFEDNKESIMTAKNECSSAGRMKHVDVKFRFVQESIKMGEMEDPFVASRIFDHLPVSPCLLLHTPCIQR